MAGRGRGKPTMSFNTEQLGLAKGELPAQVLQPPSAYPMLDLHISNFESTNELDYLVELKREFTEYMRDSIHNVLPDVQKKDIERYSDHYQDPITDNSGQGSKYDWSRMPEDLTSQKRKKATNSLKRKITETRIKRRRILDNDDDDNNDNNNDNNMQNTELKLEQQKNKQTQDNTEKEVKEDEEDKENSEQQMDDYEEVDEEMDDGTDYVNNYFDNGEGFDDEDDNLDDGPIY